MPPGGSPNAAPAPRGARRNPIVADPSGAPRGRTDAARGIAAVGALRPPPARSPPDVPEPLSKSKVQQRPSGQYSSSPSSNSSAAAVAASFELIVMTAAIAIAIAATATVAVAIPASCHRHHCHLQNCHCRLCAVAAAAAAVLLPGCSRRGRAAAKLPLSLPSCPPRLQSCPPWRSCCHGRAAAKLPPPRPRCHQAAAAG